MHKVHNTAFPAWLRAMFGVLLGEKDIPATVIFASCMKKSWESHPQPCRNDT
jgi:hypothetical protein